MFLSILDLESDCIHIPVAFKFHYVSINSASNEELHGSHRSSLNSIMFLLIPLCCFQNLSDVFDLNSIMFLLILDVSVISAAVFADRFKFHYVSINSFTSLSKYLNMLKHLNSIMFLLIHHR